MHRRLAGGGAEAGGIDPAASQAQLKLLNLIHSGQGAALMHLGAMAVIGAMGPRNLVHIVINNEAHETVGGMPTAAGKADLAGIARSCGYPHAVCVDDYKDLDAELQAARQRGKLSFIEVKCALGARADLGRPTVPAIENKCSFMKCIHEL